MRDATGFGLNVSLFVAATCALMAPGLATAAPNVIVATQGGNVSFDVSSSGALTPVAGSPFAGTNDTSGVAIAPNGENVYIGNYSPASLSAYALGSGGALAPVAGSPFVSGNGVIGVASTPDGKYLYTADAEAATIHAYAIGQGGTLSDLAGSPFAAPNDPIAVAVSPDGGHLYVTSYDDGGITAYAIAPDGGLNQVGSPVPTGNGDTTLSFTPDGRHLFVAGYFGPRIWAFNVAADGSLTPAPGSPMFVPSAIRGTAVSPDGKSLYTVADNRVWAYAIADDGSVSELAGSSYVAAAAEAVAVSPDGRSVYVSTVDTQTFGFSRDAGGELTPIAGSPYPTGSASLSFLQSVAVTPDQGPTASFTAPGSSPSGVQVKFDATGSTDPDGTVARYDWDFGDGTKLPDGGPTPSHAFDLGGDHDVTLTVTDGSGCSTTVVFTGQTASCNGSSAARATRNITVVADAPPVITKLRVTPRSFAPSDEDTAARKLGAKVKLVVSEDARVRFRIRRDPPLRGQGPPPKRLRTFNRNLKAGSSSVPFTGTLGRKTFGPGRYVVIARARDSASQRSEKASAPFRILTP